MLKPFTQEEFAQLCEAAGADGVRALRVAAVCDALFNQTCHLHGLTKAARPLLQLAAALRCAASGDGLASALRKSVPCLSRSQRRTLLAAAGQVSHLHLALGGEVRNEDVTPPALALGGEVQNEDVTPPAAAADAKGAVEQEIARRIAAIVDLATGVTCCGAHEAAVAAVLDDGQALELLVSADDAARDCAAYAAERLGAWNRAMLRPIRSAVVYAGSQPPTGVSPETTLAGMARRVFQTQWECFVSRLYGLAYDEDIEFVHELRVALRRLRGALRVFRKALDGLVPVLRRELKNLADALGRVRDADVFLAFLADYGEKAPAEHKPFLRGLLRSGRSRRRHHYRALVRLFASPDVTAFRERYGPVLTGRADGLCALAEAGDEPLVRRAPRVLLKRLKVVRKQGRNLPGATPARQHALRIECKKLRYAAEFFADLCPQGLRAVIEPMVAMQDALGDVHDADVYRERIIGYHARRRAGAGDPLAARAVDALVDWLAQRRESSLRDALATWAAFAKSKAPRKALKAIP